MSNSIRKLLLTIYLLSSSTMMRAQWPQTSGEEARPTVQTRMLKGGCAIGGPELAVRLDALKYKTIFGTNDPESEIARGLDVGYGQMSYAFGVDPDYGLYDDGVPNAIATPGDITASGSHDGAVLIGRKLVAGEKRQSQSFWGSSITLILAHEYAHIYQFKRGLQLANPAFELHADFLAGWFMGSRNRVTRGLYANMEVAAKSLFKKGDYEFNSPSFHGTPEERVAAMESGYKSGLNGDSLVESYDLGLRTLHLSTH